MKKVLIDTDVILDFFFDRKPFSNYATQLMHLCAENKIIGYTTPVIISNVYYLLRKVSNHKTVIEKLKQLLSFISILNMNQIVVRNALYSNFKDFEDALQNFSAMEQRNIKVILTRNIKDFKKSELVILTPETFLKGFIN